MIYWTLFLTFLKIGAFTFGGGYAMLPFIQEQALAHGWLDEESLMNFIAVSESTPGPFAINISTYIGMETGGLFGAFCATLGVVLPSFVIILLVAGFFEKFKSSRLVSGCMTGLRPAVIGLMASAVVSSAAAVFFPLGFSFETFTTAAFLTSAVLFALSLVLALKKCNPILLILLCAALGIGTGYLEEACGLLV